MPQLKIIIFFFLGMGFREFWRRRGAGQGGAKLLGPGRAGAAQESCWEEGGAQLRRASRGAGSRLEGHVVCLMALRDCHLYRRQGVSRHIEAAQHLEGHPEAAARRAAPASGRL